MAPLVGGGRADLPAARPCGWVRVSVTQNVQRLERIASCWCEAKLLAVFANEPCVECDGNGFARALWHYSGSSKAFFAVTCRRVREVQHIKDEQFLGSGSSKKRLTNFSAVG